jgi:signal peptidase I
MIPSATDSSQSPDERAITPDTVADGAQVGPNGADESLAPEPSWPSEYGAVPNRSRRFRLGAALRDILEAVVLAVAIFVALQFVIQNTVVEGNSMEPNFVDGERLLVNKLGYRFSEPQRGDVIVFHAPGYENKDFIKRVIGLPGDSIAIRDGLVSVNGQVLDEPWLPAVGLDSYGPYTVPDEQYFVMGDNRPHSNDSRSWEQALPRENIVGKVWLSVWPLEAWGIVGTDRPGPAAPPHRSGAAANVGGHAMSDGQS